jgi:hypothetical protein
VAVTIKHIEVDETNSGFYWCIKDEDVIIANSSQNHPTRHAALTSLFSIFFGDYDESFLELYAQWNPDGQFVETKDVGEPVGVQASQTSEGSLTSSMQQTSDLSPSD